jgi:hypothetical protein
VRPFDAEHCHRRYRRCSTKRADETNSLAAIYPELLASWDESGNHPLDPHAIKAT